MDCIVNRFRFLLTAAAIFKINIKTERFSCVKKDRHVLCCEGGDLNPISVRLSGRTHTFELKSIACVLTY